MRPMSAVERFFERLFERPSARIFRTRPQPEQLQRRIERAIELGRTTSGGRTSAPDRFTVRLCPSDLDAIVGASDVPVLLASSALTFARAHGYAVAARPRVAIVADAGLLPGDIEVEARFSRPGVGADLDLAADLGRTRAFQAPVVRAPQATLVVVEPGGRSRTIVVEGRPMTIGRSADNGLVLDDARVSRHHARIQARDGVLILSDLGSTNGTWAGGARVSEMAIGAGDRIEIGDSLITVAAVEDDPASTGGSGSGDRAAPDAAGMAR